ncbi:transposable element Tcb2 transposase [Trichonephila clavipes]|nr:transposable element Tcb2 transposase [Trichonephila clavipes]
MTFTRRLGSGRPRQISRREDRHIVRNARVQPTASSAALQAQITPSFTLCLLESYEGAWLKDIWDRDTHYVCCPRRIRLEWCRARGNWTIQRN